jgi:bifunctional DNA-binding transcriptional regulator/antitoxin component of YhaV-PrlF toxin-antitoxin module
MLRSVDTTPQNETSWFTTKGQVVIPLRFRKIFHIEDGTRAIVTARRSRSSGSDEASSQRMESNLDNRLALFP